MASLALFVTLALIPVVAPYSTGAPPKACAALLPMHVGFSPSTTPSPYTFSLSQSTYFVGQAVTVTITTRDAAQFPITAFLLQGRRSGGNTSSVGIFANPPPKSRLLACDTNGDSVTHTAADVNRGSSVDITWYPPSGNEGDIVIMGTVARAKPNFWGVLSSPVMRYSQATGTTTGMSVLQSTTSGTHVTQTSTQGGPSACSVLRSSVSVLVATVAGLVLNILH